MGMCCHLMQKDTSSQIYTNDGLMKSVNDRSSMSHDNIPYKCIMPAQAMSNSNISPYNHMASSQHSGYRPISIEDSLSRLSSKGNSLPGHVDSQLYQFMDFPFLTSLSVIRWIMSTKIIFILRGPTGSGKTTIVDCLSDKYPNATVCSPDNFFLHSGGSLEYDRSHVKDAYDFCQNQAHQTMECAKSPVIIDNAHILCSEYKYYVDLSLKYDYLVIMIMPKTPWRFDVEQLHEKSTKSEPIWEIDKTINLFEPALPLYYGWFLNDRDSDHIMQVANDLLDLFISMPIIRLGLAEACELPEC